MHLPTVNFTSKYVVNFIGWRLCVEPPIVPNVLESISQFPILILKVRVGNPIACNSRLKNPGGSAVL